MRSRLSGLIESKRGDLTWYHLLGGVIAVFVLVVMVWFLFFGGGKMVAQSIGNIIPGFGQDDTKPQEGIQIIGYNLQANTVEYYTGKQWVPFGDREVVELGDKKLSHSEVKKQFQNYYYGSYMSGSEIVSKPAKAVFLDAETERNLFGIENPSSGTLFGTASIKLEQFYTPSPFNLQ